MRDAQQGLSPVDIMALAAFLAAEDRPDGTLSFHETQGFMFTIASAPETIAPSEWLPLISNESDMSNASIEEAQEILQRLMALTTRSTQAFYNAVTHSQWGVNSTKTCSQTWMRLQASRSGRADSCLAMDG